MVKLTSEPSKSPKSSEIPPPHSPKAGQGPGPDPAPPSHPSFDGGGPDAGDQVTDLVEVVGQAKWRAERRHGSRLPFGATTK